MESLIEIKDLKKITLKEFSVPYYCIFVFEGEASFSIDFTPYHCRGKNLLFITPYQFLKWDECSAETVNFIQFHGDFYCIEYHKKEVACNGILFNNIYQQPFVTVHHEIYTDIRDAIQKMQHFKASKNNQDTSIIKLYLQLILALSSKEKQKQFPSPIIEGLQLENIVNFQQVLENHFTEIKEVAFYADKFGLSVNTFSKKIKKHFGKSPSKLIQERIVLEAKKALHLTYKPIKEIAKEFNFEDEFYFSRYFKKEVGVSPKQFREKVGISIVAEKNA